MVRRKVGKKPRAKKLIKVTKITPVQISKRLQTRKIKTAQKILASRASPIMKARAKKIVGI